MAILLVFGFHAYRIFHGPEVPTETGLLSYLSPIASFIYSGHTGVELFFLLSAYLLTRPFIAAYRAGRRPSTRRFYSRRALRILPAYYSAVVVAMVYTAWTGGDWTDGLSYFFFLDAFGLATPIVPFSSVWWSLTTEVQFYLVLPLIFVALQSRGGRVLLAVAALAWGGVYYWLNTPSPYSPEGMGQRYTIMLTLFGRGFAFVVGGALAWLRESHGEQLERWASESRWLAGWRADGVLLALCLAMGCLLQYVARVGYFVAELQTPVWHILESLLWGALFFVLTTSHAHARRWLRGRWIMLIGMLSYSIYLTHYPLLDLGLRPAITRWPVLLSAGLPAYWALTAASFVVCLLLSALTYRYVESPFLRLKQRFGGAGRASS